MLQLSLYYDPLIRLNSNTLAGDSNSMSMRELFRYRPATDSTRLMFLIAIAIFLSMAVEITVIPELGSQCK